MRINRYLSVILVLVGLLSACASAERAAEKKQETANTYYQLGVVQINDRHYSEALSEFTKALALRPDDPVYHNAIGFAYFAKGLNSEAIEHYNKAILIDPDFSQAYLNLGALYISQKKWDSAVEASRGVLSNIFYRTPEIAYNNIGWALLNKGDYVGAVDNFSKAVEINNKYAMAYNNLGLSFERLEKNSAAISAYRAAIRSQDKLVNAHYNLAQLFMRTGNTKEARKSFENVIRVAPGSPISASADKYLEMLKVEAQ